MTASRNLFVGVVVAMLLPVAGAAQIPETIKVQGFLSDMRSGTPLPANGTFSMTFDLYDAPTGGIPLVPAAVQSVGVTDGLYEVELPFPAAAFNAADRYLEITVNGEALSPRIHVVSVPFAYNADKLDGYDASQLDQSGDVSILQASNAELQSQVNSLTSAQAAHEADPASHAPYMITRVGTTHADRIATWAGPGTGVQETACSIVSGVLRCSAETAVLNAARHSGSFPDVAAALADLPDAGGRLDIDPGEDDAIPFASTNPASGSAGKKSAVVIDSRGGGIRFLSSMPEYPSGEPGVLESKVPFVFQTRLDDPTRTYDTDVGAIGEWNCPNDVPGVIDEWRNCPHGNSSWGVRGGSKQYWHSGQCNVLPEPYSESGTASICGGPHILEVRYPEQPGVHSSKPIFAVGNGGVSIYQPDSRNTFWRAWLTMFRGDQLSGPVHNTPMYVFDDGGAFLDGGTFMGSTLAFPYYSGHTYPPFNAWVQKDLLFGDAAFVVENGGNNLDGEQTGPIARFLDRTCCSDHDHTFNPGINQREAFGFYSNSVLKLGSYTTNPALDRGQYIEWEGLAVDAHKTRLRVADPTGLREFTLPDAPDATGAGGKIQVASGSNSHGTVMWGDSSDAFDTGNEVCAAAGLRCVASRKPSGVPSDCDTDQGSPVNYFIAFCK